MTIQESKARLRAEIRLRLSHLGGEQRLQGGARVRARVLTHPAWIRARVVMLFVPMPTEIDVWSLAPEALESGKRVCVPSFSAAHGLYLPRELRNPAADLHPGPHHVMEARPDLPWVPTAALDFIAVPGLAFDVRGGRLGRGKGFYDQLLSASRGFACGVGFDEQLVPEVPVEPHDVNLNAVLTPALACECRAAPIE